MAGGTPLAKCVAYGLNCACTTALPTASPTAAPTTLATTAPTTTLTRKENHLASAVVTIALVVAGLIGIAVIVMFVKTKLDAPDAAEVQRKADERVEGERVLTGWAQLPKVCKLWVVSCVFANVGHIVLFVKAASALRAVSATAQMWLGPQGNNYQCLQHGLGGGFCNSASPAVNHDYEAWSKSCESANLTLFLTAILVVGLSVLITLVLCLWALFVIFTKRPTKA